jgi:hypothetical protein
MGLERNVCVEYGAVSSSRWALFRFDFLRSEKDIIIAEDDPRFFLQVGEYVPKSKRKAAVADDNDDDVARFVRSLIPPSSESTRKVASTARTPFSRYVAAQSLRVFSLNLRSPSADDRTRNAARLVYM